MRWQGRFDDLVAAAPLHAIRKESEYIAALAMVDAMMQPRRLTQGQSLYLETLLQLIQAYERDKFRLDDAKLSGIEALRRLLEENELNASDLARILGVHASMGSRILSGARGLTVEHVRKLAARFGVRANCSLPRVRGGVGTRLVRLSKREGDSGQRSPRVVPERRGWLAPKQGAP
jgi:HTH-type transcriptional regulator/antitoxin HigA